jgi:hypothetical protein
VAFFFHKLIWSPWRQATQAEPLFRLFAAESPRPCDTSCCDNDAATTSGVGRLVNSSSATLISWAVSSMSLAAAAFWAKFVQAA